MTDEQCDGLVGSINKLTMAIHEVGSKLEKAIDNIYFPTLTDGIEKQLNIIAQVIEESSCGS